jgi:hypothetical protein
MHSSQGRPPYPYRDRDGIARDLDAERIASSQRSGRPPEEPEYYAEAPPVAPPSYQRSSRVERRELAGRSPSVVRRLFGATVRFLFALLLGIGSTLVWQHYGSQARAAVDAWAPSLSWLLPTSTPASPMAAATVPDLVGQLKPLSIDLAVVRRSLEQIAANQQQIAAGQEQIAQSAATLQEIDQEIRQAVLHVPRKPATAPSLH